MDDVSFYGILPPKRIVRKPVPYSPVSLLQLFRYYCGKQKWRLEGVT